MKNKNILRIALATAFILLLPLVAMQFTSEVDWDLFDFVVAGVLLFGAGMVYEFITRKSSSIMYRVAAAGAVATGLLLMWVNLAVGLIGSENNPANLMYFGVIAVGLIGTSMARLNPLGMARALYATAIAQALVPIIALIIWKPPFDVGVVQVLGVNAFFIVLWIASALLFRRASTTRSI